MTEDARDALLETIDPYSPTWKALETYCETRRMSIALGLLSAGSESVETARGKARILADLLDLGDEKRAALQNLKGEPPDGD